MWDCFVAYLPRSNVNRLGQPPTTLRVNGVWRERNRDYLIMLTAKERMSVNILSNKTREEELTLYLNMGGQITRHTLYGKDILLLGGRG